MGRTKGCMKTGGRTKGTRNKAPNELKTILDKIVDYEKVALKLFELSQGVLVQKKDKKGVPYIYEQPPDGLAAKTIFEFRFGRAAQTMAVSGSLNVNNTFNSDPKKLHDMAVEYSKRKVNKEGAQ